MIKSILLSIAVIFISCKEQVVQRTIEPGFIALIVQDIDSSIHWYTSILDFELKDSTHHSGRGIKQANLLGEGGKLELIEISSSVSPSALMERNAENGRLQGVFKIGFTVMNFDAWQQKIEDYAVDINGQVVQDPVTQKRMMVILDPDGNRVQLFEK